MTKIVLINISVQCWVVYPNVDNLLYGPGQVSVLPSNNVEIVRCSIVPCLLDVYRRGSLEMLHVPLPKWPKCFSYIFLTADDVFTLVAVYYPTPPVLGVLVLGSHECLLDCSVALEVCLCPILTTDFLSFLIVLWCMVPLHIPPWVWVMLLKSLPYQQFDCYSLFPMVSSGSSIWSCKAVLAMVF